MALSGFLRLPPCQTMSKTSPISCWEMTPLASEHSSGRRLTREEMIVNYRISRARRVVENAFGIMAQRWRILLSTMQHIPVTVQTITEAYVSLHKFIRLRHPAIQNNQVDGEDAAQNLIPGAGRQDANLPDMYIPQAGNRDTETHDD